MKVLQNFNIQNQLLTIIKHNVNINYIMQTAVKNELNNTIIDSNIVTNTISYIVYIIQFVIKTFLIKLNMKKSNATSKKNFKPNHYICDFKYTFFYIKH